MNGMAMVQQRIDAIESRFAPPKSVPADEGRSEDFGAVMAEAGGQRELRSLGSVGSPYGSFGVRSSARAPSIGAAPGMSAAMRSAFEEAAARYGLDVELLMAVSWQESGFNPAAVSHAGAIGLMQLMPGTAAGLGVDPRNPLENIDGGARYLRQQLDRFGSIELALAAYNAGPGAVQRHGGIPPFAETQAYVPAVIARWGRITAGGAPPIVGAPAPGTPPASAPAPVVGGATVGATPDGTAAAAAGSAASSDATTPVSAADTRAAPASMPATTTETAPAATPAPVLPATADAVTSPSASATGVGVPLEGVAAGLEQSTGGASEQSGESSALPVPGSAGPSAAAPSGASAVAGTVSTQEVPAEILRLVRQDGGVIRLQLSPQGLGHVSVQVSLTAAGDIAIEILADTDQAAVVLGRLRDTVESALRIDGFSLDSFDVSTESDQADQPADFAAADAETGDQSSGDTLSVEGVEADRGVDLDLIDTDVLHDADDPSVLRI